MHFQSFFRRCAAVASLSAACLLAPSAQAVVVRHVTSGILTGASGVKVDELPGTYSVEFVDGTCASVYGGCNAAYYPFSTPSFAVAASHSLIDDVFVDSAQGQFDSDPRSTYGCSAVPFCFVITLSDVQPTTPGMQVSTAWNSGGTAEDFPNAVSAQPETWDTTDIGHYVWALWRVEPSTAPAAIPEPGTLALVGVAGAILAWTQRRRRSAPRSSNAPKLALRQRCQHNT
jgi:hypothetical protein